MADFHSVRVNGVPILSRVGEGGLIFGIAADVRAYRSGTNALTFDDGSGGAASITATAAVTAGTHLTAGATGYVGWNGRALVKSGGTGLFDVLNWAETSGVRLDVVTADGRLQVLTRAGADAATIAASAYRVGATAGASFGPGAPASITVVNGIVTAVS